MCLMITDPSVRMISASFCHYNFDSFHALYTHCQHFASFQRPLFSYTFRCHLNLNILTTTTFYHHTAGNEPFVSNIKPQYPHTNQSSTSVHHYSSCLSNSHYSSYTIGLVLFKRLIIFSPDCLV